MKKISVFFIISILSGLVLFTGSIQAASQQTTANQGATDNESFLLEAYASAYASLIYDIQVIVGVTADAYVYDAYSTDEVKQIVAEQKNLLKLQEDYTRQVLDRVSMVKSDVQALHDILGCIDGLRSFISALEVYVDNPTDENANNFQTARQISWGRIAALLGLEK
jgi:hypothetical protein